jgi:hypothetical protein
MKLFNALSPHFELLNSNFSIAKTKTILGEFSDENRRIIISDEKNKKFYLHSLADIRGMMEGLKGNTKLRTFIHDFKLESTPVFEPTESIFDVPDKAVVIENGAVLGYYQRDIAFQPRSVDKAWAGYRHGSGVPGGFKTRGASIGATQFTRGSKSVGAGGGGGNNGGSGDDDNRGNRKKSTYFLNAKYRKSVPLDEETSIRINISKDSSGSASLPLLLDYNTKVDIVIDVKNGFQIIGSD